MNEADLIRASTAAIEKGSKSFAAAARLFDARTRESVVMLYAWCRHCDDVVDGQVLGHGQIDGQTSASAAAERLAGLETATRAAFAGRPTPDPVFQAFAAVMRRHDMPDALPLDHLAGFRMDVEARRFETIEDTLDYSYHVAGVVGVMMAIIMGVRDEAVLDRASDLGLAFQLTNICRDVMEDAAIGRVYLPEQWLREAGVPPEAIGDPAHRVALAGVVARVLDEAERYYLSAGQGIAALPPRAAWAIATARGIYREIGVKVRRLGPRAFEGRVSTSGASKLAHVALGALTAAFPPRGTGTRPALWTRPLRPVRMEPGLPVAATTAGPA